VWWAIVILSIALVLAVERINSALEALIDHLRPDLHPQMRVVNDMAAGAMLILPLASLVVALALCVSLRRTPAPPVRRERPSYRNWPIATRPMTRPVARASASTRPPTHKRDSQKMCGVIQSSVKGD